MALSMKPAPLMSVARTTSLVASFIVSLGSGTMYVFSAYSPQLGARLKISHTLLNILGSAANLGFYSSGLYWGRIVDSYGPRIPLFCSFLFLLGGYSGIKYFYDSGLPSEAITLSNMSFSVLFFCFFLTGSGGGGGLAATINSTAKSFPDRARGSATGVVVSALGLSAFFFSSIYNVFFANNTSAFLLLLSLGTALTMFLGYFLVRPIPLPDESHGVWDNPDEGRNNSRTRLLDPNFSERGNSPHGYTILNGDAVYTAEGISEHPNINSQASKPSAVTDPLLLRNLENGRAIWSGDFWLLFSIVSLIIGTGLMYINNVGSMSQFLYAHNHPNYDDVEAARWQATQVSTISLLNCLGRIFMGFISDFVKNKYDMPRSYAAILVASLLLVSQIVAANIGDVSYLWIASSLLGLAHGTTSSLAPTLCLEWFGMPTFGENWGYLTVSPIVAGNIFTFIFGRNADAHNKPSISDVSPITLLAPNCLEGLNCYVAAIYFTIGTGILTVMLSAYAGYKDRQRKLLASPTTRNLAAGEDYLDT